MSSATIAQIITALLGSSSIGVFLYGRKKAKAEAETEAIKGSSLVVQMFQQLAERQTLEIAQLRTDLNIEKHRCDNLERAMRRAGIQIPEN